MNDTNNGGRTNNMKTNADLHVDRDQDWSEAIASASNSVYRRRDLNISKRMYDEIKFMNGSYSWFKDYWNDSVQNYDAAYRNCASYTRAMWYDATGEWHSFTNPAVDEPGSLYNSIWWFNHQAGPSSQCETNTWPSS